MVNEQPTALWLADAMDCVTDDSCGYCTPCQVAAELRRLHAENERDTTLLRQALEALEVALGWPHVVEALRERLGDQV